MTTRLDERAGSQVIGAPPIAGGLTSVRHVTAHHTTQMDWANAGLPEPQRSVAVAAVLASMVLVVVSSAIANVALPVMAKHLQVTPAMSVQIITVYQMALVMALLPCGALGENFGYRRVFVAGVALFTGASLLCALAPSLPWLIAARFLQGLGGAAVMALGIALLRSIVPQQQLGAAISWNALTVALSSAAGPPLGAAVLSISSWPWLFALNVPLGLAVLLASRAMPQYSGTARRLDAQSMLLNAVGFAALVAGAELLSTNAAMALLLISLATLTLMRLVRREIPKQSPLIPFDLLRRRSFRSSVIASACCFAGQTAGLVALPFYLHHGLGQSILASGLYLMVWPLTVAVAAPIAGRLAARMSTAKLCAAGGLLLSAGLVGALLWPLHGEAGPLIPLTMLCGLGFGLFNVPNNRNMFLSAPSERSGAAGGMQGTARLVGQTAGAVIMTLLFTSISEDLVPKIGFGIGSALAMIAGLVSFFTPASTVLNSRPDRSGH